MDAPISYRRRSYKFSGDSCSVIHRVPGGVRISMIRGGVSTDGEGLALELVVTEGEAEWLARQLLELPK